MTKISTKKARQISIATIIDRAAGRVQVIRNIKGLKGFLVDSGNLGYVPIEEWREFLRKETIRANETPPTLFELYGLSSIKPEDRER